MRSIDASSVASRPRGSPPRGRLRWLLASFIIATAGIFGRLVTLEIGSGAEYRTDAAQPTVRRRVVPAMRGRILSRDGTVLAEDRPLVELAVRYRYLEEPPDPHWLRATARAIDAAGPPGNRGASRKRRRAFAKSAGPCIAGWPSCAAYRSPSGKPAAGGFKSKSRHYPTA